MNSHVNNLRTILASPLGKEKKSTIKELEQNKQQAIPEKCVPAQQIHAIEDGIVNTLTYISTAITSTLNINDVFDRILEVVINLCQADEVALVLWDQDRKELSLRAEREIGEKKTRLMKLPVKQEYPISEVLRTGKPLQDNAVNGHKFSSVTRSEE